MSENYEIYRKLKTVNCEPRSQNISEVFLKSKKGNIIT